MAGRSKFQEQQRQELFALYNYACGRCGSMLSLEEDHIIPRKQQPHFSWDLDSRDNMQCLCHDCNNWKNGQFDAENHDAFKYEPMMPTAEEIAFEIRKLERRTDKKSQEHLRLIKEHHNV